MLSGVWMLAAHIADSAPPPPAAAAAAGAAAFASLQLYKEAGVPTKSFVGVPVFQAEGLTVTTQDMVREPLHTVQCFTLSVFVCHDFARTCAPAAVHAVVYDQGGLGCVLLTRS
jgi:hypothetical protein